MAEASSLSRRKVRRPCLPATSMSGWPSPQCGQSRPPDQVRRQIGQILSKGSNPHELLELPLLPRRKPSRSGACGASTKVELAPPEPPKNRGSPCPAQLRLYRAGLTSPCCPVLTPALHPAHGDFRLL